MVKAVALERLCNLGIDCSPWIPDTCALNGVLGLPADFEKTAQQIISTTARLTHMHTHRHTAVLYKHYHSTLLGRMSGYILRTSDSDQ